MCECVWNNGFNMPDCALGGNRMKGRYVRIDERGGHEKCSVA